MIHDRDQERVSAAYRDLANESPPPALDRRILAAAGRQPQRRYGVVRAWIRPVAWAATIGLCLAILLEFTVFTDAPPKPEPRPAAAAPPTERARRDADVMRAKQEDAVRQSAPQQHAPATARVVSRDVAAAPACDHAARMTAQSWFDCIEALRDEGRDEDAAAELSALRAAFPDFEGVSAK